MVRTDVLHLLRRPLTCVLPPASAQSQIERSERHGERMRVVRNVNGTYQASHSLGSRSAVAQASFLAAARACLGTDSLKSSFTVSRSGATKTEMCDRAEEMVGRD